LDNVRTQRPDKYARIYDDHADRYDELVAAEDVDHNLLPALQAVCSLDGALVVEAGAGTGRLTRIMRSAGARVIATEIAPAMIGEATRRLGAGPNWTAAVADARALPVADGVADLAVAGWVLGHFRSWMADRWQHEIGRGLSELARVVRPGGAVIIIETLGTGFETPRPPNDQLAEYYAWLESHGFQRNAIRTDYAFGSVQEAARVCGFFFGDAFGKTVRDSDWARVPECTGVWSRTVGGP